MDRRERNNYQQCFELETSVGTGRFGDNERQSSRQSRKRLVRPSGRRIVHHGAGCSQQYPLLEREDNYLADEGQWILRQRAGIAVHFEGRAECPPESHFRPTDGWDQRRECARRHWFLS